MAKQYRIEHLANGYYLVRHLPSGLTRLFYTRTAAQNAIAGDFYYAPIR